MRYRKISDYGIIGNLTSVALVALDGSIDWLCFPYMDSPSVFGALLDAGKGGRFRIFPAEEWDSTAEYVPETNILHTRFRTAGGVLEVVDFMPVSSGDERHVETERHELYRLLRVTSGTPSGWLSVSSPVGTSRAPGRCSGASRALPTTSVSFRRSTT
jgi:GH15 family glucan-1,4-alpha-glucosidase